MTAPQPATARGYLITFTPCGHVQHWPHPPAIGMWLTHWGGPRPGCQTPREVQAVKPCPGCPGCWQQPGLFAKGNAA